MSRQVKQFHSCFMTDVEVDEAAKTARMQDSNRMRYLFRLDEPEKAENFTAWLKGVFLAGKAQTLSVFRYHEEGEAPDTEVVVDKFIGDFQKRVLCESADARTV